MHTILILNPASGASSLASDHHMGPEGLEQTIIEALQNAGLQPEVRYTTPEDHGDGLARQAAAERADLVIAAGGDGTLHAVANGLVGTKSALGIIATGTMNNIARSLHISEDIAQACDIIAHGETCQIDVGRINGTIFLEVAGIGLEAALFPAAEEFKSAGLLTTIKGIWNGFSTLWRFRPSRFRATFDGRRSRSFRAIQVSVCNTPYYGARLQFAPNAVMDDGFLDVLIYRNFSKLEYIRHAIAISRGQRALEPKLRRRKIKSLSIATDTPLEIHADGNPLGYTPATIVIEPAALHVRIPKQVATSHNVVNEDKKDTQIYQKAHDNTVSEKLRIKSPLREKAEFVE